VDYVVGCVTTKTDTLALCERILRRLRSDGNRCVLTPGAQELASLAAAARQQGARWALLIPDAPLAAGLCRHDVRHEITERMPWIDLG
jgi:hypothetical protein